MSFDTEISLTGILLGALGLQLLLMGCILLFWLHRRGAGRQMPSSLPTEGPDRTRRILSMVSLGVLATAVLAWVVYRAFTPEGVTKERITRQLSETAEEFAPPPPTEEESQAEEEQEAEAEPVQRSVRRPPEEGKEEGDTPRGGGDSRIRESVRKGLRGKLSSSVAGRTHPSNPSLNTYLSLLNTWAEARAGSGGPDGVFADNAYDRLVRGYGFRGPKALVTDYLASLAKDMKTPEDLLILDPRCGEEAEVLWGEGRVALGGIETVVPVLVMRSLWSQGRFIWISGDPSVEGFLEGHLHAFAFFGGVFRSLSYVNLPEALASSLKKGQAQARFEAFCAHYGLTPKFRSGGARDPWTDLQKDLERLGPAPTVAAMNAALPTLLEGVYGASDKAAFKGRLEREALCLLPLHGVGLQPPPGQGKQER